MKLQRPGYTETTLIFSQYLNKIGIDDSITQDAENNFIIWLYRSAGWYDKSLPFNGLENYLHLFNGKTLEDKKSRMMFVELVKKSEVYQYWKEKYYESLVGANFIIPLCHKIGHYKEYFDKFIESLNVKNKENKKFENFWCRYSSLYPLIENQKVLVINSMSDLIVDQFNSGNVHRIYVDFPRLKNITSYSFPYTFFNNGPLNNSVETIEKVFSDISGIDFDMALISVGGYGCIISDYIHKSLNKNAATLGRQLPVMFGINPDKKEEFWLSSIPEKYVPLGYEHIEGGHYWFGSTKSKPAP